MASQNQDITGSQFENSQTQLTQAGRDAVSFLNSNDNQVTINNIVLRLFGQSTPPAVDWDWAHRLLEQKQLPEIRKRLTDTLGRDRSLMSISLDQQLGWVGRSPLQAERRLQVQNQDRGVLDMRQMLIETFGQDDIAGKLLILGTPGAGKTTALLSLAEQLVCGAIANPKTVIPVLFELSTWRNDNQSIEDWLIEQLYDLHGGDRKAKRYEHWLEQQVLLPVLDGLDELELERQQECTVKLNEFAGPYPYMVVCCRIKEFKQGNVKFNNLRGAVCLEPLSDGQIQAYLEMIQQPRFWSVIQSTPALQHLLEPDEEGDPGLLRVPLFITLAARAYKPQHPFQTKADLLTQYVAGQLSLKERESDRRKDVKRRKWEYKTPALEPDWRQTQRTLGWLARQLKQNNTVELLIERIQPNWVEANGTRRLYRLSFKLSFGLIFGLIVGPIVRLPLGLPLGLFTELSLGLIIWSILRLMVGPSYWLGNIRLVEPFKVPMSREMRQNFFERLKELLIVGLFGGLLFGLTLGLFGGLNFGLFGGLSFGLIMELLGVLVLALGGGPNQDLHLRSRPNQGIHNSWKSMLWTTALTYPFGVITAFGIIELPTIAAQGISQGTSGWVIVNLLWQALPRFLVPGIFCALLFGFLLGGGLPCIQHLCLRFVLWQSGIAPWNLAWFLNYCVERKLLQRVGGRYRFLHRELLDHFAG